MLTLSALVPVVGLLMFIYFNDKKEKEPFGFLIALFFLGMATTVTAIVGEFAGDAILGGIFDSDSALAQALSAMLIVAPCEELGKFLVLRLMTWKNKNFNYSYDALVYAVFVSLGFAALENIGYVFMGNGVLTAILRMLVAVPGHACYAVFMGYFYSKAKYASLTGKKGKCALFFLLSIFVPILMHGIYDAVLFVAGVSDSGLAMGVSFLIWIAFVIAMVVVSVITVIRASRKDFCIVTLSDGMQTVYVPQVAGSWTCACGSSNYLNFCPKCGRQRPVVNSWYCPRCGALTAYNFCGNCGQSKYAPPV